MSAKHTPGNWEIEYGHNGRPRGVIQSEGKRSLFAHDRASEELQANGCLMAAAPELLGKLHAIVAWLERLAAHAEQAAKDTRFVTLAEANAADAKNYRATIADIQTAIAKAEGGAS